jgi:PilZ domain
LPLVRESRRAKRRAFDHVAALDYRDGEQPRPCQVRDISDAGARLIVFSDTNEVPETFDLLLDPAARVHRACKVAWRSPTELGVQFLKPAD